MRHVHFIVSENWHYTLIQPCLRSRLMVLDSPVLSAGLLSLSHLSSLLHIHITLITMVRQVDNLQIFQALSGLILKQHCSTFFIVYWKHIVSSPSLLSVGQVFFQAPAIYLDRLSTLKKHLFRGESNCQL